jgi:endonuclease/exonuclease/phosphatase (EEP) superfamily protein YafD
LIRRIVADRLLIVTAIGGLLPLGAAYWWPLELLSHFRVQYVVLAAASMLLAFACRQRIPGSLLAVAVAINCWPLVPYLPRPAQAARAGSPLEFDVMTLNVNSDNEAHTEIVDGIRAAGPDLIAVLELTHELDAALLALADEYPYRHTTPGFGNFGIGVLSRYPLLRSESFALGDTPAIDSIVALPAGPLRFIAAHLVPPMGSSLAAERNRQLAELASRAAAAEQRLVVCGDFNLTPYSPFFGRFAATADLTDPRLGKGFAISWPAFMPLLGIPIDHCLTRGPLATGSVSRLERTGSDHYPVQLSISWLDDR